MKKKQALPPLYGDMRDWEFSPVENLKIAGVNTGTAMIVKDSAPQRNSFLEAFSDKNDEALLRSKTWFLLHRLRLYLPDLDRLDPQKDDLSHFLTIINMLNVTTSHFGELEGVWPAGHRFSPMEKRGGKKDGFTLRQNVIPDDPDFVKMSFREWLNAISLLVEHGWRNGVNETLTKQRQSTDILQHLLDENVISLSKLLQFVEKSYSVSLREAGEIITNALSGVKSSTVSREIRRLQQRKKEKHRRTTVRSKTVRT